MIIQDRAHGYQYADMLDILSEYTDVSDHVNLRKLAIYIQSTDNLDEFKKLLPSLPLDLVSETVFFFFAFSESLV